MSNDKCCWNNGLLGIKNHHRIEAARYKEIHHPADTWRTTTRRESDRPTARDGGYSARSKRSEDYFATSSRASTARTARTARAGQGCLSEMRLTRPPF